MEYEEFLSEIHTPLKAITLLSDIIYDKSNNEWNVFGGNTTRNTGEELLAISFAIKLCAKHLLHERQKEVDCL